MRIHLRPLFMFHAYLVWVVWGRLRHSSLWHCKRIALRGSRSRCPPTSRPEKRPTPSAASPSTATLDSSQSSNRIPKPSAPASTRSRPRSARRGPGSRPGPGSGTSPACFSLFPSTSNGEIAPQVPVAPMAGQKRFSTASI